MVVHEQVRLSEVLAQLRCRPAHFLQWLFDTLASFALPEALLAALEREGALAGDLRSLGLRDDRNSLVVRVLGHCIDDIALFLNQGLAPFRERWREHDALLGRQVQVESAGRVIHGRACGIDESGALLLDAVAGHTAVVAGEVSVRADRGPTG